MTIDRKGLVTRYFASNEDDDAIDRMADPCAETTDPVHSTLMPSGNDSKQTELELVPITDQIEARVKEAVGDPPAPEPASRPPPEPTPLELAAIEPLRGALWREPRRSILRPLLKGLAIVALLALAAGALVIFTDAGRDLLPRSMQPEAKRIARKLEHRANKIGREEFYTFTDDQGVVHIVDDREKVPRKYRARAQKKR
jgi:hypothetical protein